MSKRPKEIARHVDITIAGRTVQIRIECDAQAEAEKLYEALKASADRGHLRLFMPRTGPTSAHKDGA
jgi:hypothetical protein